MTKEEFEKYEKERIAIDNVFIEAMKKILAQWKNVEDSIEPEPIIVDMSNERT